MVKMQMVKATKMEKEIPAKSHIWCIKETRKGEENGKRQNCLVGLEAGLAGLLGWGAGLGAGKSA